jgi:hypothetical protein
VKPEDARVPGSTERMVGAGETPAASAAEGPGETDGPGKSDGMGKGGGLGAGGGLGTAAGRAEAGGWGEEPEPADEAGNGELTSEAAGGGCEAGGVDQGVPAR